MSLLPSDDILYPHQREAINKIGTGSILMGGVGTGKSLTALVYFFEKVCKGSIVNGMAVNPMNPTPLFIITTARKRDTKDWGKECERIGLQKYINEIPVTVDSWNNIAKYVNVTNAFFIFDEQRVIGTGVWSRSFIKIARHRNDWILLSATPGDTWMDYVPVFIANGFYKTRAEFIRKHVVYSRFAKYPKVEKYLDVTTLERHRKAITVRMEFMKHTVQHWDYISTAYDRVKMRQISDDRWNPFTSEPIPDIANVCYLMRRVAADTDDRYEAAVELIKKHPKAIIFYNYNYELEKLRNLSEYVDIAEWNGQKHEPIPKSNHWAYLVQYTAGAEGWNCTDTNTIIFYSQNYSYKIMCQAAGRIDRLNTQFTDLYYYVLRTQSPIDDAVAKAISEKRDFNERAFLKPLARETHTSMGGEDFNR